MSASTPGPWHVSKGGRYVRYFTSDLDYNICDTEVFGGPPGENTGNAHLIAAAPELYEALKFIAEQRVVLGFDKKSPLMVRVYAALAKADGGDHAS